VSRGAAARERRRVRRAEAGVSKARDFSKEQLREAAGFPAFPLSERGLPWDRVAAHNRWREYTKSTETEPSAAYWKGFFWRDAENPGSYHSFALQFVDVIEGEPVAVWRAVTAAAGVLQGAHGGMDLTEGELAQVRARIAAYYAVAREAFSDEKITPPWEVTYAGQTSLGVAAFALAYAEVGKTPELVEREAEWAEVLETRRAIEVAARSKTRMPGGIFFTGNTATTSGTNVTFGKTDTVELPVEHEPGEQLPKKNASPKAPAVDDLKNAGQVRWEATLAPEGSLTDDGRMFAPGSIGWRELPLSLMVMTETGEGHDGAWLGGRIDRIWRDGSSIRGEGVFTEDEGGQRAAKLVAEGALKGVSVDIAVKEFEVAEQADLFAEDGSLIWPLPEREEGSEDPNLMDILFGDEGQEKPVFVVTEGVIGAATVCPFPAFADACISLTASGLLWTVRMQGGFRLVRDPETSEQAVEDAGEVLTAAAAGLAPLVPPVEWFENPGASSAIPLQITDEGRVYGYAAAWDVCHIGIPEACTVAPHSETDYSLFHLGAVKVDTDEDVAIGKITLGTGHAPKHLDWQGAAAHYDNTGTVVADVVCGEDEYGIWVSGALRPDVSEERVRELRAAVLSGDWRSFNGNLELVALLAVNVPGFPIPRKRALVAAGEDGARVLTLLAAGITTGEPEKREALSEDDRSAIKGLLTRVTIDRAELKRLAELAKS
jgi:hypothetical protein